MLPAARIRNTSTFEVASKSATNAFGPIVHSPLRSAQFCSTIDGSMVADRLATRAIRTLSLSFLLQAAPNLQHINPSDLRDSVSNKGLRALCIVRCETAHFAAPSLVRWLRACQRREPFGHLRLCFLLQAARIYNTLTIRILRGSVSDQGLRRH